MFSGFNILVHEVYRQIGKSCIKTSEIGNFLVFCQIRCHFEMFFNLKTAINSSEKPTGQQTLSVMNVCNITIHEVCHKFDKNCKKKLGKFENFFLSVAVPI